MVLLFATIVVARGVRKTVQKVMVAPKMANGKDKRIPIERAAASTGPPCVYQCDDPQCEAYCVPECNEPVCSFVCTSGAYTAACTKTPYCRNNCANPGSAVDTCPSCETQCSTLITCTGCSIQCEAPECSWRCRMPFTNCTEPKCVLQCDLPACEYVYTPTV